MASKLRRGVEDQAHSDSDEGFEYFENGDFGGFGLPPTGLSFQPSASLPDQVPGLASDNGVETNDSEHDARRDYENSGYDIKSKPDDTGTAEVNDFEPPSGEFFGLPPDMTGNSDPRDSTSTRDVGYASQYRTDSTEDSLMAPGGNSGLPPDMFQQHPAASYDEINRADNVGHGVYQPEHRDMDEAMNNTSIPSYHDPYAGYNTEHNLPSAPGHDTALTPADTGFAQNFSKDDSQSYMPSGRDGVNDTSAMPPRTNSWEDDSYYQSSFEPSTSHPEDNNNRERGANVGPSQETNETFYDGSSWDRWAGPEPSLVSQSPDYSQREHEGNFSQVEEDMRWAPKSESPDQSQNNRDERGNTWSNDGHSQDYGNYGYEQNRHDGPEDDFRSRNSLDDKDGEYRHDSQGDMTPYDNQHGYPLNQGYENDSYRGNQGPEGHPYSDRQGYRDADGGNDGYRHQDFGRQNLGNLPSPEEQRGYWQDQGYEGNGSSGNRGTVDHPYLGNRDYGNQSYQDHDYGHHDTHSSYVDQRSMPQMQQHYPGGYSYDQPAQESGSGPDLDSDSGSEGNEDQQVQTGYGDNPCHQQDQYWDDNESDQQQQPQQWFGDDVYGQQVAEASDESESGGGDSDGVSEDGGEPMESGVDSDGGFEGSEPGDFDDYGDYDEY